MRHNPQTYRLEIDPVQVLQARVDQLESELAETQRTLEEVLSERYPNQLSLR